MTYAPAKIKVHTYSSLREYTFTGSVWDGLTDRWTEQRTD